MTYHWMRNLYCNSIIILWSHLHKVWEDRCQNLNRGYLSIIGLHLNFIFSFILLLWFNFLTMSPYYFDNKNKKAVFILRKKSNQRVLLPQVVEPSGGVADGWRPYPEGMLVGWSIKAVPESWAGAGGPLWSSLELVLGGQRWEGCPLNTLTLRQEWWVRWGGPRHQRPWMTAMGNHRKLFQEGHHTVRGVVLKHPLKAGERMSYWGSTGSRESGEEATPKPLQLGFLVGASDGPFRTKMVPGGCDSQAQRGGDWAEENCSHSKLVASSCLWEHV